MMMVVQRGTNEATNSMFLALTTGFFIGLVGSFHCIGMCGPIALALPVNARGTWGFYVGRIVYNAGRTLTYTVFGAMMGLIGQRFFVAGLQQEVSIVVGGAMIISAVAPTLVNRLFGTFTPAQKITGRLKKIFASAFQRRTVASLFVIGLVNGFLPCGLVYMAMAGAATTGSAGAGSLFMAGFGMGTIPVMFGVSVAGSFLTVTVRKKLSRLTPVFVGILGLIILLRGMNLGIPMVSPKIPVQTTSPAEAPCCG
jgi:sulfite exporter TauE/SafE